MNTTTITAANTAETAARLARVAADAGDAATAADYAREAGEDARRAEKSATDTEGDRDAVIRAAAAALTAARAAERAAHARWEAADRLLSLRAGEIRRADRTANPNDDLHYRDLLRYARRVELPVSDTAVARAAADRRDSRVRIAYAA